MIGVVWFCLSARTELHPSREESVWYLLCFWTWSLLLYARLLGSGEQNGRKTFQSQRAGASLYSPAALSLFRLKVSLVRLEVPTEKCQFLSFTHFWLWKSNRATLLLEITREDHNRLECCWCLCFLFEICGCILWIMSACRVDVFIQC